MARLPLASLPLADAILDDHEADIPVQICSTMNLIIKLIQLLR